MDMKGEKLREIMYKAIEKYGHASNEVLVASQKLDTYINENMKGEIKFGNR
jgi:hypothetical protein